MADKQSTNEERRGRALGVGGIFFRSRNPALLGAWYENALGIAVEAWGDTRGTSFAPADMPDNAFTVWSAFAKDTEYFGPSGQAFMINLVVDDLEAALDNVNRAGGTVLPEREDMDFGRFGWFEDPEGNRVELWEPPTSLPDAADDEDAP